MPLSRLPDRRATLHAVDKPEAVERLAPRPAGEQLERILRSETFQKSDRLKRFLMFIVRETAAGRAAQLKEYVIGVQVFRKEDSFDPRTDPIVRVQARRLRAKLVRYYREEGQADPTLIELPKGGYAPLTKHRDDTAAPRRSVSAALVSRNTITVLPFANHNVDGSPDAICKGMREEVVHHLARLPGLRILAAHTANPDAPPDAPVHGGAALVIAGSVRQSGDRLRIAVHLIDGASGCYLWSESVDGSIDDVFGVQDLVARTVAAKLDPDEADPARRVSANRPAANLAAQNLYLQGRYHLNQRTEEGLRKSLDFFERALGEDAQYALAHSGMADAYGLLAHYGVRGPAEVWTKAASSAKTAVMLDGFSAEAHTSFALVRATQAWDWAGAEREYQRAISLNPKYATAHHWYAASCLAPLGRLAEALDEMTLAQSLDPISSIIARDVAMIHYYRRDFETALERCDHAIELNPHFAPAYWLLGLIQAHRRDFDESLAALQRAVHLAPQTPRMHGALGRTFALSGRRKRAHEVLRKLESYASERYVSPLEFAWIRFALGDVDLGFHWLTKACADRSFDLISVKVDPRFDPLRDDERFAPIVGKLGLGPVGRATRRRRNSTPP
jgi:TolB-like protein/Flp pilus assembly protein TadD